MRKVPEKLNPRGSDHAGISLGERSLEHEHADGFEPEAPKSVEEMNPLELAKHLFVGIMEKIVGAVPLAIRRFLLSFFGVCAMIAPLALWIAPSKFFWFSLLGFALFSIVMCYIIVVFGPEDTI